MIMKKIDKGIRLTNYLIDGFIVLFVFFILWILLNTYFLEAELFVAAQFLYYFIFESLTGQTLGKMVTNTKVVSRDGSRPKVWRVFMRSFLRLIPIDNLSYLFGTGLGFHDVLSFTKLKKISY